MVDTGAWDALGEQGWADHCADNSARSPARRIGTASDIANAVLFAMTSTFLTGATLRPTAVSLSPDLAPPPSRHGPD
ncbi:hypothetical protein [Streptomyces sp. NPDC002088]|uniref:hypothetical protein n=1 Tax=Streptomyces sp. NPDC002088 TaxID=3154665 RepID=UPI00331F0269